MKLKYYAALQIADCIDADGNEFTIFADSDDDWLKVVIEYANTNRSFFNCEIEELFPRLREEFGENGEAVCESILTQITSIAENKRHLENMKEVIDCIPGLPEKLKGGGE